jgi:hypothetical protein
MSEMRRDIPITPEAIIVMTRQTKASDNAKPFEVA